MQRLRQSGILVRPKRTLTSSSTASEDASQMTSALDVINGQIHVRPITGTEQLLQWRTAKVITYYVSAPGCLFLGWFVSWPLVSKSYGWTFVVLCKGTVLKQGRSDGGISAFIPPKSAQVNFLWGKNDVIAAIQQFYTPKLWHPLKHISGYAPVLKTRKSQQTWQTRAVLWRIMVSYSCFHFNKS